VLSKQAVIVSLLLLLSASANAALSEYEQGKKKKADATVTSEAKVPWRNSTVTYSHSFSAISLNKGAEMEHNPYYTQSFSFRPRYYLRDDLSLRARLNLEIELTTSDATDHAREWILSDLLFDVSYGPKWMTIPYAEVKVNPSLRMGFPTSIVSRGRSLMFTFAPGVAFRRRFDLLKGRFLKNIGVMYAFRFYKYLHEFKNAQIDTTAICTTNVDNPACVHSGIRNRNWRINNTFEVRLQILEKLTFTIDLLLFNDILHKLDAGTYSTGAGPDVTVGESQINHRASVWGIMDVSYDVFDWLWLSTGISTFHGQLTPDSNIRAPFFNRFTAFYFDVTLPIDPFVKRVQGWVRR
jgi:hypothetical protein